MNQNELVTLIDALIRGEIRAEDHDLLQARLKADSDARDVFRERIDLEASLRTWAEEAPSLSAAPNDENRSVISHRYFERPVYWAVGIGVSAALLLIAIIVGAVFWNGPKAPDSSPMVRIEELSVQQVGLVLHQQDCKWGEKPFLTGSRFAPGTLHLMEGVAELEFDSGVHVLLEGPCEFVVSDRESARLLAGNVFVHVTEISNGFVLQTPDAQIVDEGTQYAVALNDESTEVHVFDGAVTWLPADQSPEREERVEAGQARRYQRGRPAVRQHIPLGERQFVRQIEETLKKTAGDSLLAYDGFENLAGQLRRDRSGFGWSGGWQQVGRGRGKLATVADAPPEVVFGVDRTDRRLLVLNDGNNIRREFVEPLSLSDGDEVFVSLLIERLSLVAETGGMLQISLETEAPIGRRRWKTIGSFGFTTAAFPFLNVENAVSKTAAPIETEEVYFVVVRISSTDNGGRNSAMRVFRPGESIPIVQPSTWTLEGGATESDFAAHSLRVAVGQKAHWRIDELKVGSDWHAVTTKPIE